AVGVEVAGAGRVDVAQRVERLELAAGRAAPLLLERQRALGGGDGDVDVAALEGRARLGDATARLLGEGALVRREVGEPLRHQRAGGLAVVRLAAHVR